MKLSVFGGDMLTPLPFTNEPFKADDPSGTGGIWRKAIAEFGFRYGDPMGKR